MINISLIVNYNGGENMSYKTKSNNTKKKSKNKIRLKDIKEKKVYYVDFEPSVGNEFGRHHLSIVLKKNHVDKSLIVVPLTGRKDKITPDKTLKIKINGLPERLQQKESYAVVNKIRTVDFSRFEPILDGEIIEVEIETSEYMKLISYITDELEESLSLDQKKEIYDYKLKRAINKEIKNLAYIYKKRQINNDESNSIVTKIMDIIYYNNKGFLNLNEYEFNENDKRNELENTIIEILDKIKSLNL